MLLEGSCHCGAVRFRVESGEPAPFMLCYCSICRKTAGGGGFSINLGADAGTLEVEGEEYISVYRARMDRGGEEEDDIPPIENAPRSPAGRNSCGVCGSALWLFDPRWPDLIHPHASAIDTPLPKPPERNHIMLDFVPPWIEVPEGGNERHFPEFPDESLAEWHERHGLKYRE